MKKIINIHFLPAKAGDCILIEFDNKQCILVDSGYKTTYRQELRPLLKVLSTKGCIVSLLVITHIDEDHISGAIELLSENGHCDSPKIIRIENIWFNGFRTLKFDKPFHEEINIAQSNQMKKIAALIDMQMPSVDTDISVGQAKAFELLCAELKYPLNKPFENKIIMFPTTSIMFGDIEIKVISPDSAAITKLGAYFSENLYGLFGKDYELDQSEEFVSFFEKILLSDVEEASVFEQYIQADTSNIETWIGTSSLARMNLVNQASIVFELTYKNKTMLFMGDSDSSAWQKRIKAFYDIIKVSHHGTLKPNLDMIGHTDADYYLISTDGEKNGHPEKDYIARLITAGHRHKKLCFNYDLPDLHLLSEYKTKYDFEPIFKCSNVELR